MRAAHFVWAALAVAGAAAIPLEIGAENEVSGGDAAASGIGFAVGIACGLISALALPQTQRSLYGLVSPYLQFSTHQIQSCTSAMGKHGFVQEPRGTQRESLWAIRMSR